MIGKEAAVKPLTLLFQDADSNIDTRLAKLSDSSALYFGKGVNATHNYPAYSFLYYQIGTGGRLAVMRTRF